MKYDKTIERQVKDIKYFCDNWLDYVEPMNQCAMTDRILENIEEKCYRFLITMELREKEFKRIRGE